MKRTGPSLLGLSLCAAALLSGLAARSLLAGLLLLLPALLALLVRRPVRASGATQVALSVVAIVIGVVGALAVTPADATWYSGRLTLLFCAVAFSLVLAAIPRLAIANPVGGARGTALVIVIVLMALGTADSGPAYPILGSIALLLAFAGLNQLDPNRTPWNKLTRRNRTMVFLTGGLAATITTALALSLPLLYDEALRHYGLASWGSRTGFSTRMTLGSLSGMLSSDEEVLRIYGPRPDYLRGVVYRTYWRGRWMTELDDERRPIRRPPTPSGRPNVEIWPVGRRRRYFVPLDATDLRFFHGDTSVDRMGIFYPPRHDGAGVVRFRLAPRQRFIPASPGEPDLQVPPELVAPLHAVATEWSGSTRSPEVVLQNLVAHLRREFTYSLDVQAPTNGDPVVSFLQRRRGHCEYFASALALLARTQGIPARLVAGYRVVEFNRLGGDYIVRERNAHAWVEAWLPDRGWTTWDATPPSELSASMPDQTPWASALADLLSAGIARIGLRFSRLEPWVLWSLGGLLVALWITIRWVRRKRRDAEALDAEGGRDYRPARATLVDLLDTLATMGLRRAPGETLEALASRVETEAADLGGSDAAEILRRYAAWRYGHQGDPEDLDEEISRWIQLARTAKRRRDDGNDTER